ncbi:MAG: HD domain-containing phosphohydrolase [Gaiellaceae bacterium]
MPRSLLAFVALVIAAGAAVVAYAVFRQASSPLGPLALLAAAAVVAELLQIPGERSADDPLEANAFSFSSAILIAGVVVLGPWAAAVAAVFAVLLVDSLREERLLRNGFNAGVFALASVAGGLTFQALGGAPGELALPADLGPLVGLAAAYLAINAVAVAVVTSLDRRAPMLPLLADSVVSDTPTLLAEAALGATVAFWLLEQPWGLLVLAPLALSVYLSQMRLTVLRRETAHTLNTFANVIDERDAHTYRHSARVAEYVGDLAERLRLPSSVVARLRWAGRLHDLGKFVVDAAILRKPGKLEQAEWDALRSHPRISSKLLRRFRFARDEALAVEYHHERYDGKGYYGISGPNIPLMSHFLIVADSYDAMTSDRAYRPALSSEAALREIERNLGSQFHPAVGKAFVAVRRGRDPLAALTAAERAELRRMRVTRLSGALAFDPALREAPFALALAAVVAALAGAAAGRPWLALTGAIVALAAAAWRRRQNARAAALTRQLATALEAATPAEAFETVVDRLRPAAGILWAGIVAPDDSGPDTAVAARWSVDLDGPSDAALASWLLRESAAEPAVLTAPGSEVGHRGRYVAVPLGDDRAAGYLVVGCDRWFPAHVERALRASEEVLRRALAPAPSDSVAVLRAS